MLPNRERSICSGAISSGNLGGVTLMRLAVGRKAWARCQYIRLFGLAAAASAYNRYALTSCPLRSAFCAFSKSCSAVVAGQAVQQSSIAHTTDWQTLTRDLT